MSADDTPAQRPALPSAWILLLQMVALLLLVAIRFAEPVGDGDLFWQMAYGKYLLANRTLVPDHTIYSWTPADNPFIYCSWLAEIVLYLMHSLGGLPLLFAFRYLVVLLSLGLMLDMARRVGWHRRAETWLFLSWYALASYVGSILKPELFSLLFMASTAWLLFAFRLAVLNGRPYRGYLIGLVVTMVLWANSHGVFFFGLIALGAYTLGELLNWAVSPGLALPPAARRPFVLGMLGCLGAAFITPYHIHLVAQLVQEGLGVVFARQSSGDKAAYASLAAHMSIWRATAFHFHEYLVMGVLVMLAVVLWGAVSGKPGERFDWSYLALNGLLAALYTVYLRTTFYWPAFFLCSTLYQLYVLQQRSHQGKAEPDSLTDFFFVGAHLLAVRFYYGSLDQLAQWLKASPEQSVKVLAAIGFALQAALLTMYVWIRLKAQQSESDPPRRGLSALEPRGWLTTLALVATLFLSSRACYESVFLPYSSSWCGFGITYWNPVDEVEFLKKYHPDLDRIVNDYDSGGYLLWMLYPKTKVMIDPRSFPYRKFWADYIQYERGQIGLNFLERFGKTPEVSIVSLKNDKLWRSFLFDSKNWVPAWCGTAYVIFVKRGFTYPPDAVDFMPERFETLRNAQKAMQIYRFAIEANAFELAWKVLDVMTRKFNTTPEEKRLVQNLEAYKECLLAIQAKDFERATRAQENCYRLGMFVNVNLLMELYKQQLVQLKQAGKKTSDPEMRVLLEKAQRLSEGKDPNTSP